MRRGFRRFTPGLLRRGLISTAPLCLHFGRGWAGAHLGGRGRLLHRDLQGRLAGHSGDKPNRPCGFTSSFVGGRQDCGDAIWLGSRVMMQAGPGLWCLRLAANGVCGPATCDGSPGGDGAAAKQIVLDVPGAMSRHPAEGGPEVMEMPRYWHPNALAGRRDRHSAGHWGSAPPSDPFLAGMPNRGKYREDGLSLLCRGGLRGRDGLAQHAPDDLRRGVA